MNWEYLTSRLADSVSALTRRQHFSVQIDVMSAFLKLYDVMSEIRLRISMRIYVKNIPAKFHPYPIWSNGVLGFFRRGHPNKKKKKKKQMSSDMRSVPDLERTVDNEPYVDESSRSIWTVGCCTAIYSFIFDLDVRNLDLRAVTFSSHPDPVVPGLSVSPAPFHRRRGPAQSNHTYDTCLCLFIVIFI